MSQQDDPFATGLAIRRDVLGVEMKSSSLDLDTFGKDWREFSVGWCWGAAWGRPGLDRRSRSIATLAMLVVLRGSEEIKMHVKGALRNGLTPEEIKELILHATIYAGVPAGGNAWAAAVEALQAENAIPVVKA